MTHQIYEQLQTAYDFLNQEIFEGRLPACLITVQRDNERVQGYFSRKRFAAKNDNALVVDEIAMNPMYFVSTSVENVLATLAHEMVHLEQFHFGRPGRGRYHNKEWADWMERIGLMPSDTSKIGGKRTGDRMGDYIIKDGRFDNACKKLMGQGWSLGWFDKNIFFCSPATKVTTLEPINYGEIHTLKDIIEISQDESAEALIASIENDSEGQEIIAPGSPPDTRNKITYVCPACEARVWGKRGLSIICGECVNTAFVPLD